MPRVQVDLLHKGEHLRLMLPTDGIGSEEQLVGEMRGLLLAHPASTIVGVAKRDLSHWFAGLRLTFFDPYDKLVAFPPRGSFADLSMCVRRSGAGVWTC